MCHWAEMGAGQVFSVLDQHPGESPALGSGHVALDILAHHHGVRHVGAQVPECVAKNAAAVYPVVALSAQRSGQLGTRPGSRPMACKHAHEPHRDKGGQSARKTHAQRQMRTFARHFDRAGVDRERVGVY